MKLLSNSTISVLMDKGHSFVTRFVSTRSISMLSAIMEGPLSVTVTLNSMSSSIIFGRKRVTFL